MNIDGLSLLGAMHGNLAQGRDHLANARAFRQETVSTAIRRAFAPRFVRERRKQDHFCWYAQSFDQSSCLNPVHPGHVNVHQDKVRFQVADELNRFLAVSGLSRNTRLGHFRHERLEEPAKGWVVIRDQDFHGHQKHLLATDTILWGADSTVASVSSGNHQVRMANSTATKTPLCRQHEAMLVDGFTQLGLYPHCPREVPYVPLRQRP
ncbi:MAG: hypothetical protein WAM69_13875 [Candidatus Sulfotelmatobacter sp.]